MYLPLIFFFLSLVGIIMMIGFKLALVRNGHTIKIEHSHPFVLDLQKMKHLTLRGVKRFGYLALFVTIRFFVKSSNSIKNTSKIVLKELQEKFGGNKNSLNEITEKKEVSKYLKIIGEYRQKIKEMKHKIKEEEGIE